MQTGFYNGQISHLQDQIDRLKSRYYDIRDYGMSSGDNIYDALFDLIHDVVYPNGGGIIYFPAGNYTVDYTIVLPDNVTLIGDGDNTVVTFTLDDNHLGSTFFTGGSNITIQDMRVEIDTNIPYPIRGALPNTIGITDFAYDSTDAKRSHNIHRQAGNNNIKIINVDSLTSNYSIQMEPQTYGISDIYIYNHRVPTGMFSIMAGTSATVKNVFVENLICDTIRFGTAGTGTENINLKNVFSTMMDIEHPGVTVDGFTLYSSQGNRESGYLHNTAAIHLCQDNIKLLNGTIYRDAASPATRIISGETEATSKRVYLSNIIVDDPSAFTAQMATVTNYSLYCDNLNFDPYDGYNTVTGLSILSGQVPRNIVFNCNRNKSRISGLYSHTFGNSSTETIGTLNAGVIGSDLIPSSKMVGSAILYKWDDRTIMPEICNIILDTDGTLKTYRESPSSNSYDAITFDLIW